MTKVKRGAFIMVDGIDGSGKGTVVDAYGAWAKQKGLVVFDVRAYAKGSGKLPQPADWQSADLLLSAEPTHAGVGRVIREEIVHDNGRDYSGYVTAEAFSLDRLILYKSVILPALAAGKTIIQERGVSSSIAYQPAQGKVTLQQLLKLEGNAFALKFRPDLLLIAVCPPDICMRRLQARTKKQDKAIFEKRAFLTKLDTRYRSSWFINLFQKRGSVVGYIDTNDTLEETKQESIGYINDFLTKL